MVLVDLLEVVILNISINVLAYSDLIYQQQIEENSCEHFPPICEKLRSLLIILDNFSPEEPYDKISSY